MEVAPWTVQKWVDLLVFLNPFIVSFSEWLKTNGFSALVVNILLLLIGQIYQTYHKWCWALATWKTYCVGFDNVGTQNPQSRNHARSSWIRHWSSQFRSDSPGQCYRQQENIHGNTEPFQESSVELTPEEVCRQIHGKYGMRHYTKSCTLNCPARRHEWLYEVELFSPTVTNQEVSVRLLVDCRNMGIERRFLARAAVD